MSVPLIINGITFQYPQEFDKHWGPVLTNWSTAVTNALKPLTGGFLTLPFPTAGIVFRNSTNTANLPLTVNGSNQLTFNGLPIGASTSLSNSHIFVGNVLNQPADVALTGDASITNTGVLSVNSVQSGAILDAGINASAAISLSKLASTTAYFWYAANGSGILTPLGVTASRAVATDANGLPVAATTTSSELNFVSGVTSAIQTQLNTISSATSVNTPPGVMVDYAGTSAPTGWLLCDGSAYATGTYPNLFSAIGYTWGNSGGNFRVPNMSRRVSVGSGGSATATLGNTVGSVGGEENHTLTTAEIPSHTHTASVNDSGHTHSAPTISGLAGAAGGPIGTNAFVNSTPGSTGASATGITVTISSTGGGGSHNNIQPSAVVTKIIKY